MAKESNTVAWELPIAKGEGSMNELESSQKPIVKVQGNRY